MRKFSFLLLCLMMMVVQVWAQTREVTGRVVDLKDGSPLVGATVKLKGTTRTAVTDANGMFKISAEGANGTLQVSFVGFDQQDFSAAGNNLSIGLSRSNADLSEVVVVGYGQTMKRELTSSVAKVKGAEIANMPVQNFLQGVQGRAAGVFVESQNGKVGEGIKVRIRGASSVSASNAPLYVIDGIPVNTGSLSGNALADINFNDVESFDILKDAAATAIYGSRGANGVVLITTKKGKAGKPRFNVNMQYGSNNPTNKREFLNSTEYLQYFREAAENAGRYHFNRGGNWFGFANEAAALTYMTNTINSRFDRYSGLTRGGANWRADTVNTNWEDLAFQKSNTRIVEANAAGGSDKTKYFISGSYNDQDGILFYNNFKRYSGRMNLEQELSSRFKVGVNTTISRTEVRRVGDDNQFYTPMQIVALAPITPVRNNQGVLFDRPVTTYYNPLIETENASFLSTTFRNINTVYGQYNISKGLTFRSEYGLDVLTQNDKQFYGRRTIVGQGTNGYGSVEWLRSVRYTTNNYLNYNTTLGKDHSIDATVGMSFEKLANDASNVEGQQYANDDLRNIANAATITAGSSSLTEFSILSYFGRVNYKYKNKYLIGLSARADGSSVFGENKRFGFFPAASIGWLLSEEDFLKNNSNISFLKLRASYGSLGNQQGFGNYAWRGVFGTGRYAGSASLFPASLQNDLLTWETTNQFDAGFEIGFKKNRIVLEVDYYNKRSAGGGRGFIYNLPLPVTSGFSSVTRNIGEIQNYGLEFTLNTTNISTKDFRWTTSLNMSYNRNKVLKIDGQQDTLSFNDGRYMNALIVNQPIGVHYGPRYAGVDPANGDALYIKPDGKTTTNDYNEAGSFVVGDPNPKWFGGVTNTFNYKDFELSFLIQGVFDYEVVNGAGGFMSARGDWFDNQTRDQLKGWKKPGDITNVPQARLNWFGDFQSPAVSTQYMEDASYVRLKNLTFAYNVPQSVLKKVKLSSAKVYVTGVNLLTWTNYTGWDPEVNTDYRAGNINQGGDFYAAPQIRSVSFGINLGF
jgi:TonB-linked SusC/RagA family outer membrane protein